MASSKSTVTIYRNWFSCDNAKAITGRSLGYLNAIHFMAPADTSGGETVCPWAQRCVKPCLTSSGMGGLFPSVKVARQKRALLFKSDPKAYIEIHRRAIAGAPGIKTDLISVAKRMRLKPALRLNGTSDIPYEHMGVYHEFQHKVRCYEYSKGWKRVLQWLDRKGPFKELDRFHLTMSLGGTLDDRPYASATYREILEKGGTIAAVWDTYDMAKQAIENGVDSFLISGQDGQVVQRIDLGKKWKTIDGNKDYGDLRFMDPPGVIVALYAKGRTGLLDTGPKRFFLHHNNPSSSRSGSRSRGGEAVVTGLPMSTIRNDDEISIDVDE